MQAGLHVPVAGSQVLPGGQTSPFGVVHPAGTHWPVAGSQTVPGGHETPFASQVAGGWQPFGVHISPGAQV